MNTVLEMFEEIVKILSDKIAVSDPSTGLSCSYYAINECAGRVALSLSF